MSHFLPLGSVVQLKGAQRRVMIVGRVQQAVATNKLYDYSACAFPVGYMGAEELYMFNNADVETVYFLGCQDEEELRFRKAMEDALREQVQALAEKAADTADDPADGAGDAS